MDNFGLSDRLCETDESDLSNMLQMELEMACDEVFRSTEMMEQQEQQCTIDFDGKDLDLVSRNLQSHGDMMMI